MSRLPAALLEHLREPRNVGEPPGGHDRRGEARNAACRDHVVVYLRTQEGHVTGAGFRAHGCPAALGTGSAATELLPGLPADSSLVRLFRERFVETYGEPAPLHRHAVALIAEALDDALARATGTP